MYDTFYGLTGRPFQLTPDPDFYFESTTHRKALSYLGYGLAQGEGVARVVARAQRLHEVDVAVPPLVVAGEGHLVVPDSVDPRRGGIDDAERREGPLRIGEVCERSSRVNRGR